MFVTSEAGGSRAGCVRIEAVSSPAAGVEGPCCEGQKVLHWCSNRGCSAPLKLRLLLRRFLMKGSDLEVETSPVKYS